MNVEDWGHGEIPSNSGNSPLLSLDCDMTEEDNVHIHNNQSQTNHWFAQIPRQGWDIWTESLQWEGLGEVLWLCLLLNRAKSTFKWVLKGPGYLSLHANLRLMPSLFI